MAAIAPRSSWRRLDFFLRRRVSLQRLLTRSSRVMRPHLSGSLAAMRSPKALSERIRYPAMGLRANHERVRLDPA